MTPQVKKLADELHEIRKRFNSETDPKKKAELKALANAKKDEVNKAKNEAA